MKAWSHQTSQAPESEIDWITCHVQGQAMRALLCFFFLATQILIAAEKPNIIIILADDLGYGDVHCNNPERGKIPTPSIDKLASQGMRFTDGHSSSGVCSPSRYALLTGRYHWRSRLQRGIVGYLEKPLIVSARLTLASMLKQCGYHSACIGKWHLGWDWPMTPEQRPLFTDRSGKNKKVTEAQRSAWNEVYAKPIGGGPTACGFDEYFGTDVPNWPPYCFIENDRTQGIPSELLPAPLLKNALASIGGPALEGWKLENILPTITQRACDYITRRSAAKEPFFLYLPLTAPHTPLAPSDEWKGKSGFGRPVADLIMQTDAAVGRVLEALESSGAASNTLVLFTSDNGFAAYTGAKELETQGHFPSGPLRGYKTEAFEGGHRIPFIIRWPGTVKQGAVCDQLVQQTDIMATLAEITGHEMPENSGEDSFSLLSLLRGGTKPVREHAINHAASGLASIRQGSWKLIAGGGSAKGKGQIYDLAADLGEKRNLWDEKPELATEMLALMDKLVTQGRSNAGAVQKNDVPVDWRRFLNGAKK
jgi:arylsulfatase A